MTLIKSKAWKWDEAEKACWSEPSEESHYLLYRWKRQGKKNILDLGCGIGRHSIFFAENGFNVTAFDLSETGIKELDRKSNDMNLKIETAIGDMISLPYSSESFDCVLAFHSIYHTDSLGIEKVASEIKRVLAKDGEVYLTLNSKNSPSFNNPTNERIDDNTILKTEGNERGTPHYYVDEETVKRLMNRFNIIKLTHLEEIDCDKHSWHYFVLAKMK